MKKQSVFALILSLLLLAACVPTPEQEFVVNKGDDTAEQKLNASPASDATDAATVPQFFPDRWDEDAERINEHVSIAVHADVVTKADGLYPVYRMKDAPLSEAMARTYALQLLGKPVEAYTSEPTKADIGAELKEYLDRIAEKQAWIDAGKPDDGADRDETVPTQAEIDATTQQYMERIQKAPDTLETRPVTDYSGLHMGVEESYTLASGEKAFLALYDWGFSVWKDCSFYGELYTEDLYAMDMHDDLPVAKLWQEVTMEREKAEEILNGELQRLNLSEYGIASAKKTCLLECSRSDQRTYRSNGWTFTLRHNPGGYPTSSRYWEPSQFLRYGDGDEFAANKPVSPEEIILYIDESGLRSFQVYNRREIVGMPNANVELMPFSEIRRIAKNALAVCLPYERIGERDAVIEIYQALLTTYTLRVRNSDEYYEMPCWVLYFDGLYDMDTETRLEVRESLWESQNVLVLNAVDGSIVHNGY